MWYKVRELQSKGLNKSQISRKLGIYRGTVRRYLSMTEEEFVQSNSFRRDYGHKLDVYKDFILSQLEDTPYLSSSQIEDRLKEHYPDFGDVCSKTVYNYVIHLRFKHNLPKNPEDNHRQFEKLPESPFGEYAQVDFGERYMNTSIGTSVKVYFFVMVMCRSRQKFIYFSQRPFNTALTVYAHELAFQYYGGKPEKIIYDQDKVLLHAENLGDLILTHGFRSFVSEQHFECIFCRKSDPESKGKVENVVKYVKGNFMKGRTFTDIQTLNAEGVAWLERTGNGSLHHGIHRIPADVFEQERSYLIPYVGIPTAPKDEMREYKVRKDNTINYRCCYYTVPTGSYINRSTTVFVEERNGKVLIYSHETGKLIATHELSTSKGKLISNSSHKRDRSSSYDELEARIKTYIQPSMGLSDYLSHMRTLKQRYYRDSLNHIIGMMPKYTAEVLTQALSICMEKSSYNAYQFIEVAETIRKKEGICLLVEKDDYQKDGTVLCSDLTPEKSGLNVYNQIF